jgi:hypothetical protein
MMDWGTIIAGSLTLAVFSFLYRDNPVYKWAESLLIGVSIGYTLVIAWTSTVMAMVVDPLSTGRWGVIIPLGVGLMLFGRFFPQTQSWSRIPIAVIIGSGAGAAIPAMLDARILNQVSPTVAPLWGNGLAASIGAIVLLTGVLSTLAYFYFSRERTGWFGAMASTGTWFLMIFFGTTFGYTVMSRVSTFIGRMEFVLGDFLHVIR